MLHMYAWESWRVQWYSHLTFPSSILRSCKACNACCCNIESMWYECVQIQQFISMNANLKCLSKPNEYRERLDQKEHA